MMGFYHFNAINFRIFSKSKSSHFGVGDGGLWMFIYFGWLTVSSNGIKCYACNYWHETNGVPVHEYCLEPVKNNVKVKDNNDSDGIGPYVCWKTTWNRPVSLGGKTMERYSTTWVHAENEGATLYKKCITKPEPGEGPRTYCYCATDLCNAQPGVDTTDLTDPNATTANTGYGGDSGNRTSKILQDFSANVICVSLILIMYFSSTSSKYITLLEKFKNR